MPLPLHPFIREVTEIKEKRFRLIQHITQIYDGDIHWLNIIFLKKNQIDAYFNVKPAYKKTQSYHMLGYLLSSLIPPSTSQTFEDYLKNYLTILTTWKTATRDFGTWTPKMKAFFGSKGSRKSNFNIENYNFDEEESIIKTLTHPHLPFMPSYTQTVLVLCDLLRETYTVMTNIILNAGCNRFIETFYRIDNKVKKILETMAKDIEAYAREMIKKELNSLMQLSDTEEESNKTSI
ncbi:hypothetical protein T552_02722 [Pneumocystis carinii B80]|uniref:Uncharacterized protein n=1 Tax=Pneumocystis carinii (strain B80) TaxID=1408658 RepID=A0A0W4ZEA7_PNEC8|nr:hypothetical protein T552_02722 [Pneumocystis carinii B80]KTW26716.1 hypothetical protein T552_02722 [Pneumocystis carinii B80]